MINLRDQVPSDNIDTNDIKIKEYIGQFKDDKKHGLFGTCYFKNGDYYSGGWKDDKMDTTLQL